MDKRIEIKNKINILWNKITNYFDISLIPLKIHWTKIHTVRSATGSAVTPDYINRSKKKISPYVNITIPDNLNWFNSHIENIKIVLIHEAIHFRIPKHTTETRNFGYNHNIDKDTYTKEFMNKIQF